jgi:Ca2+-binding EF-hand superfamily protein
MKKTLLIASAAALSFAGTAFAAAEMGAMADKTVTRAEAEARAKDMFAKMDANSDGKLDKGDHEARQVEHFKKLDTDGNGSISQTEFLAAHKGMGAKGPEGRRGMGERGMNHDGAGMGAGGMRGKHDGKGQGMGGKMMMRMADANKDGAISRDEFVAAHLKHFETADTNKDGSVTPEERKAAMQKMHEHMKQMKGKMGAMRHGNPPPPPPQ